MRKELTFFYQLLSESEIETMKRAAQEEVPVDENKMFEPFYKLKTGLPVAATMGLEDRMCINANRKQYYDLVAKQVEGIQEEIDQLVRCSPDPDAKKVKSLLHYIRFEKTREEKYSNGILDKGRGQSMLANFQAHPKAIQVGLSEAELVATRLYTTLAYKFMNDPLRDDDRYRRNEPCLLPVTTFFAWNGIKKLRALHVESGEMIFWRGMRNREVPDDFMQLGGTELAFMSTTKELSVAVRFCLSKRSLLFKIVSPGFMTMGADVQWLSAFPEEEEILYPPLTYLKPTGRSQVVKFWGSALSVCCSVLTLGALCLCRRWRLSGTGSASALQLLRSIPS